MKKTFLPFVFALLISFSASAQTSPATSGKSVLTDQMIETVVKLNQKKYNLTPEQMVQNRKVLADYRTESDVIANTKYQSIDQLKAAVKKASLDAAQGYKSFLTPEQYKQYVISFNELHPNAQIH